MREKNILFSILQCVKKSYYFISYVKNMKWRYIGCQFFLTLCLCYIPLVVFIIRTQPAEMYERLFSEDFSAASIYRLEDLNFSEDRLVQGKTAIYFFRDSIVYNDQRITLSIPQSSYPLAKTEYSFNEIFGIIAVYNEYITRILLPILVSFFLIVGILHIIFFIFVAGGINTFRATSTGFSFGTAFKIAVMASLKPAIVSAFLGLIIPVVHLVVFQIIEILLVFRCLKRYDKEERKLLAYVM